MTTKKIAARIPLDLVDRIDESRGNMREFRGVKPTFTTWVIEALAEKLNRENELKKK